MSVVSDGAFKTITGKSNRQRISMRDRKRIQDEITRQLKIRYGKHISVMDIDKHFNFKTNFEYIYKTERGRLYGHPPDSYLGHLFYTTHALDRFEERIPPKNYKDFTKVWTKLRGTPPSAADILSFHVSVTEIYGRYEDSLYLYIPFGALVIDELHPSVHVVKTFLAKEMLGEVPEWRQLTLNSLEKEEGTFHLSKQSDMYTHTYETCVPEFYENGWDYATYHRMIEDLITTSRLSRIQKKNKKDGKPADKK